MSEEPTRTQSNLAMKVGGDPPSYSAQMGFGHGLAGHLIRLRQLISCSLGGSKAAAMLMTGRHDAKD
jgi:hypothetical protein